MVSSSRLAHLVRFYELLERLEAQVGGRRSLAETSGQQPWPKRGVYFFFEPGEVRTVSGNGERVVRVGTHAVSSGSKTTLWQRLSAHRGTVRTGGGNHRGSIFRLHVGTALQAGSGQEGPTWGVGSSAPSQVRDAELPFERQVSATLGHFSVVWLEIDDEPGASSLRAFIEQNAIALLSGLNGAIADAPSEGWLGRHAAHGLVRRSGLWNVRHVADAYDPGFLDTFAAHLVS